MRKRNGLIAACLLILLAGTALFITNLSDRTKNEERPSDEHVAPTEVITPPELSAWIVDWQWQQGLEDLSIIKDGLTSLQLFAAYFDEQDRLYFTDKLLRAVPEVLKIYEQNDQMQVYLSIVNDQIKANGESVQKDSSLITRLMATKESRKKHVDDLIKAVHQFGLGGIEIDYEQVEEQDWERVLLFYSELYKRLQEKGKSLRIVLEPKVKIEQLMFPEGPDYVMMAYNLYGTHSGPGPKADQAFIKDLAGRMAYLPGKPYMAFSVGGFDWHENGKVVALTEERADLLLKQTGSNIQRDEASGSIFFEYIDEDHDRHTVWYADDETLSQWLETAKQAGYNKAAIWRLGEIDMTSLDYLNLHK